jgi:hypothetical protein
MSGFPARRALLIGLLLLAAPPVAAQSPDPFRSTAPTPAPLPAPRPRPAPIYPSEPAVVAPQPAPASATSASYDGNYVGTVKGQSDSNNLTGGNGSRIYENCNAANVPQNLEIRNGQFTFILNRAENIIVRGNVGIDGTLAGFAPSYYGGARLTGRIQNNELIATAQSASCTLELRLRKQ